MIPLERAARAAAEQYGEDWDELPAVNPIANGEPDQRQYLEMVRAALQEIREPSAAMVAKARCIGSPTGRAHEAAVQANWRAMIDEILK